MDKNIKAVFDDVCSGLSIDMDLFRRVERYRVNFVTRNKDHAEFFGGNLTGCYVVRFTSHDRDVWFEDIIQTEESELTPRCNNLIDPNFYIVAGDVFSLSCVWLTHAITASTKLSATQKADFGSSVLQILQYRYLTSRMQRHWVYPVDKAIAEATVSLMTNKYAIKYMGSWNAVIQSRADDIFDPKKSIHRETIKHMDYDIRNRSESVGYMLTDTQGRCKSMLKNIYGLQLVAMEQGLKIKANSATFIELDGEAVIKDKTNSLNKYRNYIMSVLPDRNGFVKDELVQIIVDFNKTMPEKLFLESLDWLSANSNNRNLPIVNETMDMIVSHVLNYISVNKSVMKNKSDLPGLLSKMKGVYTSSRSTDEELLNIRENVEKWVTLATKNSSPAVVAATRTGLLLYILLRTFTMQHYTSK